jgi:hypothetical protein
MSLFHHQSVSFAPVDPYADVRDEIAAEQDPSNVIHLQDEIDEAELERRWEEITREARAEQEA